jgi:hypothetical protein
MKLTFIRRMIEFGHKKVRRKHDYALVEMTNNVHRFASLFYSIYRILHVSAVVCHHGELLDPSELHENTDRYELLL